MSASDLPAAQEAEASPSSPYAGLPPRAAQVMRRFELGISALLLTVFLVLLTGNHLGSVSSVAPLETGSLETWEGWEQRSGVLLPLALSLVTLALVFCFSLGARMWRSLRSALRTALPATIPLGQFLLAYGVLTLLQAGVVSGLPAAALVVEQGPTATLGQLERDATGRSRPITRARPLAFGDAELPLEGAGAGIRLHRETFASWLVVADDATAPVRLDGEPVAAGETVQVHTGASLEVGPYRGVYRAPGPQQILGRFALAQTLALIGLLLGCRLLGGAGYLARLGLVPEGLGAELLRGAGAWVAFLPVYMVAVVLGLVLAQVIGFPVTGHSLVRTLEREGLGLAPMILLQAVVLAPLMEEILFRGFLLQGFSRPLGHRGGLWASALAFGCIHDGLGPLLPMTALGFLFGGLFLSSPRRSLVGSMCAHALHNAANLGLVILLVSVA